MSRHHHAGVETAGSIQHDYRHLSQEDFERAYGVELNPDGSVFDPVNQKEFNTLNEWISFEAEQDEMDYAESYGHGKQTHEDYY